MSALPVPATLSTDEARSLTDEVKADAERLWRKLAELYEGEAHIALGYGSWHSYCTAEFGLSEKRSYQLLDAGRVASAFDSTPGRTGPPTEKHARELAPLRNDPEALREAWTEVMQTHDKPTSADVREIVQQKVGPMSRRAELNAEAEKRRVYTALTSISGYCSGISALKYERVIAVATDEDRTAWERQIAEAISALNQLRKGLREVRDGS